LVDALGHLRCDRSIWAARGAGFDLRERHLRVIDLGDDVLHALHPREHLDAGDMGQQLARDGARGDATDRLARARATTTLPGADAVLGIVGVVGLRGPVGVFERLVRRGARVFVSHQHRDRRAQGLTLDHARQDFHLVRFVARRGQAALAGAAAIQIALDLFNADG
jgi:hypothetical protein